MKLPITYYRKGLNRFMSGVIMGIKDGYDAWGSEHFSSKWFSRETGEIVLEKVLKLSYWEKIKLCYDILFRF